MTQYIDIVNIDYINMNKEKRLKSFNKTTKRLSQYMYNEEHIEVLGAIYKFVAEHNCSKNDVLLNGTDYPDEIGW